MLGSSSRCLFKGRPPHSNSVALGSQALASSTACALRLLASRPRSFSIQPRHAGRTFRKSIHAVSYFDFSRPDFLPSRSNSSDAEAAPTSPSSEDYFPPIPSVQFLAQGESQQRLAQAMEQQNSDASWDAYIDLDRDQANLPRDVFDLLIALQCCKPVRVRNLERRKQLITQTCDRILQLIRDRQQSRIGGSSTASEITKGCLDQISPYVALRLLYLLIVENEQNLHAAQEVPTALRPALVEILTALTRKVEQGVDAKLVSFPISLRGRLVSTLARSSATTLALQQLHKLVDEWVVEGQDLPDPRPFEQVLSRVAEQAETSSAPATLPSPVDKTAGIDPHNPVLQALHLTLRCRAEVYNQVLHRCLDTLDSRTLAWLLPFQPKDVVDTASSTILDETLELSPRWHPWQTSAAGTIVSMPTMQAFGDRVAFVLAKRGVLQPVLHILENSNVSSDASKIPSSARQDLFEVALRQVADRIRRNVTSKALKTATDHHNLMSNTHLVTRIYDLAAKSGAELNASLHRSVIHAFSACVLTSVANLGLARARYPQFPESLAETNEKNGSRENLMLQLRRFTAIVLSRDHDMNRGSLDYASHATLLGLHLRVRDYTFSKKAYQLIRQRRSHTELWTEGSSQSLYKTSLHDSSAPDRSSFGWLFVESVKKGSVQFCLQLYLDWIAGGNKLSSRLSGMFMKHLLSIGFPSLAHRVLQEMQDTKFLVPRRVARSFVISFADAGFPEFAVEMARALASQAMGPHLKPTQQQGETAVSSTVLGSGLQILCIALDRASKADVAWTVNRQKGMFRLFDEFRIGLTHQIIVTKPHGSTDPQVIGNITFATRKHVRMAYNAVMRSHMALQPSPDEMPGYAEGDEQRAEPEPTPDRVVSEANRDEIKHLLQELQDLGLEPDSDTWTIQILAALSQQVQGQGVGEERLLEAVQLFMKSTEEDFVEQGVPIFCETDAKPRHIIPVQVHPRAVAELIYRLLDSSKSDLASDVYSAFQASQIRFKSRRYPFAQFFLVEQAHLYILAAQGRKRHLEDKLRRLEQYSPRIA